MEKRVSQRRVARDADLSQSTLCAAETGRLKPYPRQLEAIARALGYEGPPEELLDEVDDESRG